MLKNCDAVFDGGTLNIIPVVYGKKAEGGTVTTLQEGDRNIGGLTIESALFI